jgi:rhomboid family GlyGly-CTERM serine protease
MERWREFHRSFFDFMSTDLKLGSAPASGAASDTLVIGSCDVRTEFVGHVFGVRRKGASNSSQVGCAPQQIKHELWFFAGLILLLNLPLLNGNWASAFAFHPDLVRQGEWWRVLTFPFVHVSVYHLALDATAFFLLYSGLREQRRFNRMAFVVASALGSLLVSLFAAPQIYSVGLCGLSGGAHGLMAVSALEMMQAIDDRKIFWAGAISFLFVAGKAGVEAITGQVVFAHWHFGNLGTPIAVCHAGGILGAVFVWYLAKRRQLPNT